MLTARVVLDPQAERHDLARRSGVLVRIGFFDAIVERVPADAWSGPSPCARWRALDVLGHVGKATAYGIEALVGEHPR